MSFELVPPRLGIDDLIEYFGYQHNARGYKFIFDMINYYGLKVYVPMSIAWIHEGDYAQIPELMKFDIVICQITRCFFNENTYGLSPRKKYYKKNQSEQNPHINNISQTKSEDEGLQDLIALMKKDDSTRHITASDSLHISVVLVSGNRLKCFTENKKTGNKTDYVSINYDHC